MHAVRPRQRPAGRERQRREENGLDVRVQVGPRRARGAEQDGCGADHEPPHDGGLRRRGLAQQRRKGGGHKRLDGVAGAPVAVQGVHLLLLRVGQALCNNHERRARRT